MGFNKAKGRMFKSVAWTWNPCAGCTHACKYCWAESLTRRWGKDFAPVFREKYLQDKFPNDGSWIFVGSMGDLFCEGMETEWILKVLKKIETAENNTFLLQTKNPLRFSEPHISYALEDIKDKIVLGTTLESTWDTSDLTKAPAPYERAYSLMNSKRDGYKTFLSLEPLADFDLKFLTSWIRRIKPEAIEIGLENYTSFTKKPSPSLICDLVEWLDKNDHTYILKENLDWVPQAIQEAIQ